MQESEKELQDNFIELLKNNGYEYVSLKNEDDLISNFKTQLESFNHTGINNFDEIFSYLCENTSDFKFDKLRTSYNDIKFIDFSDFSSNIFQVAQEISIEGKFNNRYDVTLLINGLPLIQIELKNSSVNLQDAFGQIQRYSKHSYSNLFDYVQIFVISNKVHTRYFLNQNNLYYNSTYVWNGKKDLESFTNSFLKPQKLINFISKYIFKDLISNEVKMLRPYQVEAIESVECQIEKNENGYLWMSYNTGKSLTSLRLAQLLSEKYKVVYLTLDHLSKYPSAFKNKKRFLKKLERKKLAISNIRIFLSLKDELEEIKDEKIIFILNEYERFNKKYDPLVLKNKFKNSLFYCFTSAPTFDENLINDETTKFIFDNKIYSYSLKDALMDNVNLNFEVQYVDDETISNDFNLSSKTRIKEISDYILDNINEKTFNQKFKSIVFTSSNYDLIEYYSNLKDSELKIAPILRYDSNDVYEEIPLRDYFEIFLKEYNESFNSDIESRNVVDTSNISDVLENDIIKKFKEDEIDLLLIDESMITNKYKTNLLGNLKNPQLNTIFLDCNLKYESLFEVLTMVNEIGNNQKSYGNIITFRDIRKNINDAIKLFSNNNASEKYILKPYSHYLNNYKEILNKIDSSDNFIESYEELSTNYYILERFEDFNFDASQIEEFNQYKDMYNHEKYRLKSSKKIIPKFNLKAIDEYTINLDYIDDLLEDKIKDDTYADSNIISSNLNQTFNDNSKELNIHDESKNINISELHIHLSPQNRNDTINTNIAREKLAVPSETPQIIEPVIENSQEEPFEETEFVVNIHEGDLVENLKFELDAVNLAPHVKKIVSKECPYCGKRYSEKDNYCLEDAGVKLINPIEFKKVCPECGMKFRENAFYCINHPGVKLQNIDYFPKICPKCGRRYKNDYNFCLEDIGEKLVTADELVKYCPNCGAKYPKDKYICSRCEGEHELKDIEKFDVNTIEFSPNQYFNVKSHQNNFNSLDTLLTQENIYKLNSFTFTQNDYNVILDSIIKTHELIVDKLITDFDFDLNELDDLSKVLLYAKTFVKVKYKSKGFDLGRFIYNHIYLDDRKPGVALQITTILHELSHFLISEILEQIIMEVLDTKKNNVIEAFVCFILIKNDFNNLLDEFSAHSVESKYSAYGYQDFSSYKEIYNKILKSGEYDNRDVEIARLIGNSFAKDIEYILDAIISKELRNEILDEFKYMDNPHYRDVQLDTDKTLPFDLFLATVKGIIVDAAVNITEKDIENLQKYIDEFEINNT